MVVGQEAVEGAGLPFPLSSPSDRYSLKYDPVWQMGGAQLEPVCYTYGQPLTSPLKVPRRPERLPRRPRFPKTAFSPETSSQK